MPLSPRAGSLIRRSGQAWKIGAYVILSCVGLVLMLLGLAGVRDSFTVGGLILIGGCVLTLAGFVVASLIRCPDCRKNLFWKAITEHGPTETIGWLGSLDVCPACGGVSDGGAAEPGGVSESTGVTRVRRRLRLLVGLGVLVVLGYPAVPVIVAERRANAARRDLEPGMDCESTLGMLRNRSDAASLVRLAEGCGVARRMGVQRPEELDFRLFVGPTAYIMVTISPGGTVGNPSPDRFH